MPQNLLHLGYCLHFLDGLQDKYYYALRLVLQNVNDLLLIKFLLQMIIIISSSGFNKHTLSQALNLLISLLGKQFAKNRLAMSSVFYFKYLGQTNCFAKISLAQNFISNYVVSSMKLPNSNQKLEIAQNSSNDCIYDNFLLESANSLLVLVSMEFYR